MMETHSLSLSTLTPNLPSKDLRNQTFIGIDFGTSTTVVSFALFGDRHNPIQLDTMPFQQRFVDGRVMEHHLVPSAIAWCNDQLLVGAGAWQLKHKLREDCDLWHSFKMRLGTDLGAEYRQTVLATGHPVATIERPLDAAKVFFRFLKQGIDAFVEARNLPRSVHYTVSIPASFESNQRRDLLTALEAVGITVSDRAFIDEPNAAFLSYLAEFSANNPHSYQVPDGEPLRIMVFDFGAGTCDISVLEVGRDAQGIYSKNLAISRFMALGGNDIDQAIARKLLLPQVLRANQLTVEELRTAEMKRLVGALLGASEQLKIKLCKNVATQMVRMKLPALANGEERIKATTESQIRLPKRTLDVPELSVSYQEFAALMTGFLDINSRFDTFSDENQVISIFTPIHSALHKAGIKGEELDMILLIGGSAQNPYVQNALAEAFPGVDIERPQDMRAHVSRGAAIHAELLHGFGFDLIRPITSEPILFLTREGQYRTLIPAGTEIPCASTQLDHLRPHQDGQQRLTIPIYVSSSDQLLHVIEIESEEGKGFMRANRVTLQARVNADKVLEVDVSVDGRPLHNQCLNPFANRPITATEREVYETLREANDSAVRNKGRPEATVLQRLAVAYEKAGNHQRCAEVYEALQQLEPHRHYETSICYHYSRAGRRKLSDDWAEIAYRKVPSAVSAFNYALHKEHTDKKTYCQLMEEAIERDPKAAYALLAYGRFLKNEDDPERGQALIDKAFRLLLNDYEDGLLPLNDYQRLVTAARLLGETDLADRVHQEYQRRSRIEEQAFDKDTLLESAAESLSVDIDKLTKQ